ncbi:hypothetical protein [Stakelama tenebrarum]|uniref:Uncharacterized protein n=1 Tax=Stakelama tenebrarum TaxID=2711215 RepID=A0A6G6Y8Y0_9SPHN|nr:hypothetical protein [Sphingosinithalassobacter tenebrarum]QIG81168.1 hypothetical protein G5C33_16215 [Sphingosinithalassobacter tenebrarum]
MKARIAAVALAALLVSACSSGSGITGAARRPGPAVPVPTDVPLTTAVMGQQADRLFAQFGAPTLDISEGRGRKVQFANGTCVLDAYLYPPENGRGSPTVTFMETRLRDGSPIDPSSCIASLRAR